MGKRQGAMEDVVMPTKAAWQGVPVFLTGHTGFKGTWLTLWLHALGARIHGYALNPSTVPAMFDIVHANALMESDTRADLADLAKLKARMAAAQPRVVFHLAAQALVLPGYADPVGTFASNVMGTAHLLEAVRSVDSVEAVVVVTTDKIYENHESGVPYREGDPLGGHDPYSASKAAAEIVTASYRSSFFACHGGHQARIATARAGNVIGGGDWATDRLVPDCIKAFMEGRPVTLRHPGAVRPWQHVLEPLAGYLQLAEALMGAGDERFCTAWNFGPDMADDATVGEVARMLAASWGEGARIETLEHSQMPREAELLRLDSTHARAQLGWQPHWRLQDALMKSVSWYKAWHACEDMAAMTRLQIEEYA